MTKSSQRAPRQPRLEPAHLGGATALLVGTLGLIPGFLPALALVIVFGVVAVVPFLLIAAAGVLVLGPPYLVYCLLSRRQDKAQQRLPQSAPTPPGPTGLPMVASFSPPPILPSSTEVATATPEDISEMVNQLHEIRNLPEIVP
jgi:hypothetical protein